MTTDPDPDPDYGGIRINQKDDIAANITLDLISSFMLQTATQFKWDMEKYMRKDIDKSCGKLVKILIKHDVCRGDGEGWLAIVPALIRCENLFRLLQRGKRRRRPVYEWEEWADDDDEEEEEEEEAEEEEAEEAE